MSAPEPGSLHADMQAIVDSLKARKAAMYSARAVTSPALAPVVEDPARRAKYIALLCRHDWHFEYADDYSAWARGSAERSALHVYRAEVDSDSALWNSRCPPECRI